MTSRSRAVIYARYSSDKSREASIPDQIRVCQELADRHGWEVIAVFQDAAISGASSFRTGYEDLLAQARSRKFDVVVAESLDRLSRDQTDVALLYKTLKFADVQIWTLSEGQVNEMHVGLKGTMNAIFLIDLAAKTHRGLRGRVEAGKAGGGLSYGYSVVLALNERGERICGDRLIHPDESRVVQRIFAMFAGGNSPIAIAKALNAEKVPGPGGRAWQDTTIRGHAERGTGILRNELYIGKLVWNRMRYLKDPDSGRRVSRMNEREKWVVQPVPNLRILDAGVWSAVQSRLGLIRAKRGADKPVQPKFWDERRPKHLLTGKVFCGSCGGTLGNTGKDYLACTAAQKMGTCSNRKSVKRPAIEKLVTDGLRHHLMDPLMFSEFAEAFSAECDRSAAEGERGKGGKARELAQVRSKIGKLVDAVADGLNSTSVQGKLAALEEQEAALQQEVEAVTTPAVRLAPDLASLYRAELERLGESADADEPSANRELIRGLVDRVTVTPAPGGDLIVALEGDIVAMIGLAQNAESGRKRAPSAIDRAIFVRSVKVVAGTGFEPVAFRL